MSHWDVLDIRRGDIKILGGGYSKDRHSLTFISDDKGESGINDIYLFIENIFI